MEWDAEKYENNSQMQFKIGMHAIDLLNPLGSEKVLDIGSGTGALDLLIAQKLESGTIVGVDPDSSMIAFARQAAEQNDVTNFSAIQASATQLDFHEEFDAVFSNIAINWIENVQKLFRVLYAALKPGGRLVIAAIYGDDSADLATEGSMVAQVELSVLGKFVDRGFSDICPAAEFQAHVAKQGVSRNTHHQLKFLQRALTKAGFYDIQLDAQQVWNEFETLDAFMDSREAASWLEILYMFPANYRENARLRLRDLLRAEWEEVPADQREDPIREMWPVVFIQARKE
ncbi:MAG TPA: class I SAM-dependent methyltransferase [Candidatus Lokiarchaeia archaeon]|nr:class I SAM-dependent methyltransferase [Candidatus Lokiarchaeia archaeon]